MTQRFHTINSLFYINADISRPDPFSCNPIRRCIEALRDADFNIRCDIHMRCLTTGNEWADSDPQLFSRYPVLKIQDTTIRQTRKNPSVAARLTSTPTSDVP